MATETLADIRDSAAAYREALGLVRRLIEIVGDDPDRPGLVDTPARVVRSWGELYSGYRLEETIPDLLRTFESPSAGDTTTVIVNDIPFTSLCEHHMLPFTGTVNIRYTPAQGLVLGLSKLPRLVGVIAARLQIQERIARRYRGRAAWQPRRRGSQRRSDRRPPLPDRPRRPRPRSVDDHPLARGAQPRMDALMAMPHNFTVIQLGSGIESAVMLEEALAKKQRDTRALIFAYSRQGHLAVDSAAALAEHYGVEWQIVDLRPPLAQTAFFSGHTSTAYDLPSGARSEAALSYVPMRNLIFAAHCAAYAESLALSALHLGEWVSTVRIQLSGYSRGGDGPFDAGSGFTFELGRAANYASVLDREHGVTLSFESPYGDRPLIDPLARAIRTEAPLHLTRSCQLAQPDPCRDCYGCIERAEAFAALNVIDPLIGGPDDRNPA